MKFETISGITRACFIVVTDGGGQSCYEYNYHLGC